LAKDSKDKDLDFIKRPESLNGMKRYFGIKSQEDDYEFQRYIKSRTSTNINLQQKDKSTRD
jgi:hypothetical protein